jgi:D-aspartate ligase
MDRFLSAIASRHRGKSPVLEDRAVPAKVPAVVVGGDANGLGVVRSLGAGGVPVITVDDDPRRPGMHSRFTRAFAVGGASGEALAAGLMDLRARFQENPVLFLTYDYHVRTVSAYREQLQAAYRFRLPDDRCVSELLHKSAFQRIAEGYGFPVPRAVVVRGEQDLADLRHMRFPAVVKPGAKELFFNNKAPRAHRVFSREEAVRVCREILPRASDLIVQEWIEGGESDICFCLQYRGENGVTVSSFTGRKLRCWPPQTGNTLSCVAAPEVASILEPLTTSFFDAVRFTGMCSLEFKRDRNSDKFFMIEPTIGRTDWQEEIATLCGVNIPFAAYCHELGLSLPFDARAHANAIWRAPTCYWRSLLVGRSSRDRARAGAKVWRAAWRADDPVPFAYFCLESLGNIAHRAQRWLRSLISGGRRAGADLRAVPASATAWDHRQRGP